MNQVEYYEGELNRIEKLLKQIRAEINELTLFMNEEESTKKHRTAIANISELLGENGY